MPPLGMQPVPQAGPAPQGTPQGVPVPQAGPQAPQGVPVPQAPQGPTPAQIQQMLLSPNPQVQTMGKQLMATMKPEGGLHYDAQGRGFTLNALGQPVPVAGAAEHVSKETQAKLDQAQKHFEGVSGNARLSADTARRGQNMVDARTGNLEKVPSGYRHSTTEPGKLEFIPGGPADPNTKEGKLGNRESVYLSRVMTSANEVAKDLENVVRLPLSSSTGMFGGRTQGGSLFSAGKEALTNSMTSQEVQTYNTMATGFQRNLASIEASGLAPPGGLSHQMDAVMFKEGDTNLTKLQKLAQIRQIAVAGMETAMANPRVPEQQRKHMEDVVAQIKKAVPFTNKDILDLQQAQQKDPSATLGSILGKGGTGNAGGVVKWNDLK
jgi:hypothetical protein